MKKGIQPKNEEKDELRGTYTTPVNFQMVYLYFWAWLTNKKVVIKDILMIKKNADNE